MTTAPHEHEEEPVPAAIHILYGDCDQGIVERGWEHGVALPTREPMPPGLPGDRCER
jgi:hypothetical protein